MGRRVLAIVAMLALLAPAAQGLPDVWRLLQPVQCFMDCAEDGGPCCCETFGFTPPEIATHRHGDGSEPATTLRRPRSDRCTDGCRAVFTGKEWSSLHARLVELRAPEPLITWTRERAVSALLEPASHSPSRPRAPPESC